MEGRLGLDVAKAIEVTLRVRVKITQVGVFNMNLGRRSNKRKPLTPFQVVKRKIANLWFDPAILLVEVSELKD